MNRQEKQLSIGVFYFNGQPTTSGEDFRGYQPFSDFPIDVDVWNSRLDYAPDYLGSASSTSLSGVARANPSGYRPTLSIALDNSLTEQANKIRGILNKCANQFDRVILGGKKIDDIVSNGFRVQFDTLSPSLRNPSTNGYTQAVVHNTTLNQQAVITAYFVGTRQLEVDRNVETLGWAVGNDIEIIAKPNLPSYLGVKRDGEERQFYTIEGGTFGIERELTIGSHIINLNLRGRERLNVIPTDAIL